MKVEDALYHACHDYEGGIGSLAPRMEIPENTLYHMANPRDLAHPWSLKRFRQVLAFTGDKRPLHALCEENGAMCVPMMVAPNAPDAFRQATKLAAEFGDVARTFEDAMRDGRLTLRERDALDKQIYELIAAAAALGQSVHQLAESNAPVRAVK